VDKGVSLQQIRLKNDCLLLKNLAKGVAYFLGFVGVGFSVVDHGVWRSLV
jgi:hypothetical protein